MQVVQTPVFAGHEKSILHYYSLGNDGGSPRSCHPVRTRLFAGQSSGSGARCWAAGDLPPRDAACFLRRRPALSLGAAVRPGRAQSRCPAGSSAPHICRRPGRARCSCTGTPPAAGLAATPAAPAGAQRPRRYQCSPAGAASAAARALGTLRGGCPHTYRNLPETRGREGRKRLTPQLRWPILGQTPTTAASPPLVSTCKGGDPARALRLLGVGAEVNTNHSLGNRRTRIRPVHGRDPEPQKAYQAGWEGRCRLRCTDGLQLPFPSFPLSLPLPPSSL